ncbi:MAG TPA: hypothetical protein ENK43_04360 [Planctomycetes bacterium]|nr:hypothetical protein [Planctomycetota bacterium]
MSLTEEVTGKLLKIYSKQVPGQIVLFKDGTAPTAEDSDATIIVTDGFKLGYNPAGGDINRSDRICIAVDSLECSRTGKILRFRVTDFVNQNNLALGYGDRIRFLLDQGPNISGGGSFPSWHSNALPSSVMVEHFQGFIRSMKRVRQEGGISEFQIEAVDALTWSDEFKVVQSLADGINIPTFIVGEIDPKKDKNDWFLGIKKIDNDPTYGFGNPRIPDLKMTVGDILDYLQVVYATQLSDLDMLGSSGIFDSAELATLTYVPPKMVFENQGFGSVVRRIMRTAYPDYDIRVDPRTRIWHFVDTSRDLIQEGFTTVTSQPAANQVIVADAAGFATTGPGSSIRLASQVNLYETEVLDVQAVDEATKTITFTANSIFTYVSGDLALPMDDVSSRPPTIPIDLEQYSSENSLSVDLSQSYSAVRVIGTQQKTERIKIGFSNPNQGPNLKITPTWNPAYDSNYSPSLHQWRTSDRGADGDGVVIDSIETVNAKTRIHFSSLTSAYLDDHEVVDGSGNGEWTGAVVLLLTQQGLDIEPAAVTAVIEGFYNDGWVDAPTNTIRRYSLHLDRDIQQNAPYLQSEVVDGVGMGDRFELTQSSLYQPQAPNQRWTQGRVFHIENTTAIDEGQFVTDFTCPPEFTYPVANQSIVQQPVQAQSSTITPSGDQNVLDFFGLTSGPSLNANSNSIQSARIYFMPSRPVADPAQKTTCIPQPPPPLPKADLEADKFSLEVHQVRVPATGNAGGAFWNYKHAKELIVSFDSYEDDSQDEQFAAIGSALWRRFNQAQYTGQIDLIGLVLWLPLADLGFRVTLGSGTPGISNDQARFYGLCQSISYDFNNGTASIAFDSRGFLDDLRENLFERKFVSETAEMRNIRLELERQKRELECLRTRPNPQPPPVTDGCSVYLPGGQTVVHTKTKVEIKEDSTGIEPTGLDTPNSTSDGGGGPGGGAMNYQAPWVVERDFTGAAAAFFAPNAAIYGGTENGTLFTPDPTTPANWMPLPFWNLQSQQEIQEAFSGIDLQSPPINMRVEIDSGSTATVLQLKNAIPNDGRFDGGFIEFAGQGFEPRPQYAVASHTGSTVTLASAMAESIPTAGMVGILWPKRIPTLDATDFPNGGTPFLDALGNWVVASGGTLTPATLTGNTLTATTGSPPTPTVDLGNSGATQNVQGTIDFSSSTVVGLSIEPGITLDFRMRSATSKGVVDSGLFDSNGAGEKFAIPSGKKFLITQANARITAGATGGTYSISVVVDDGTTTTVLATGTGIEGSQIDVSGSGTMGSPLGTITGPATITVGWRNDASSPGAIANATHWAKIAGVVAAV